MNENETEKWEFLIDDEFSDLARIRVAGGYLYKSCQWFLDNDDKPYGLQMSTVFVPY